MYVFSGIFLSKNISFTLVVKIWAKTKTKQNKQKTTKKKTNKQNKTEQKQKQKQTKKSKQNKKTLFGDCLKNTMFSQKSDDLNRFPVK